jgi:uncharacterized protein
LTANLPDINLLIALSWKNHIHHVPAVRWFELHRNEYFATCPVTESGFIRLSMNISVVGEPADFRTALSALKLYHKNTRHVFWDISDDFISLTGRFNVSGYRQITDAYLLGLAVKNNGTLVTFDRKIADIISGPSNASGAEKHLVILDS